jgi:hypothetical protein
LKGYSTTNAFVFDGCTVKWPNPTNDWDAQLPVELEGKKKDEWELDGCKLEIPAAEDEEKDEIKYLVTIPSEASLFMKKEIIDTSLGGGLHIYVNKSEVEFANPVH